MDNAITSKEISDNQTARAQIFNAVCDSDWPDTPEDWPTEAIDAILARVAAKGE